jgi:hypothetical protein
LRIRRSKIIYAVANAGSLHANHPANKQQHLTLLRCLCLKADGFVYRQGTGQILILRNPTAGALSPVIDGDAGTTVSAEGLGQINVAGGYAVGSIAVGAAVAIPLDAIYQYLQGTVAINSGVGLVATLLRTK